jgi:protein SCO1/2
MWVVRSLAIGVVAVWLHACAPPAPSARQYELEGQILAVRLENGEVLIKHGDIKGFMPGMTMPFKVRDPQLLRGAHPGDLVRASLMVTENDAWIATLEPTGTAPLDEPGAIPAAAFVEPLRRGDPVPDAHLTDHLGHRLVLSDWRGHAVAVTFIYVRCPLPQFCPLLDRRFAEVQRAITSEARLSARARLLSVSFDPDADTTERLRAHAARLKADANIWRFATAPRDVVDRLAAQFGVNVIREPDGTITHNMRTTVIGPDGRVVSVHDGSDWTPAAIVDDLRRALSE